MINKSKWRWYYPFIEYDYITWLNLTYYIMTNYNWMYEMEGISEGFGLIGDSKKYQENYP